jgi:tRNA nucleotidyltransferase/poly(A) polymerase
MKVIEDFTSFRAIRFASRYNFRLADDLLLTASNTVIHKEIYNKITRERVLKEFSGMLNSKGHTFIAILMLYRLDLLDSVLSVNDFVESHSGSRRYDDDYRCLF